MLIHCPECGGRASDDADGCPHCGYRIAGREHLRYCKTCRREVMPVQSAHDTISRFCPQCSKAITNLGCRRVFLGAFLVGFVVVVAVVTKFFRFW